MVGTSSYLLLYLLIRYAIQKRRHEARQEMGTMEEDVCFVYTAMRPEMDSEFHVFSHCVLERP